MIGQKVGQLDHRIASRPVETRFGATGQVHRLVPSKQKIQQPPLRAVYVQLECSVFAFFFVFFLTRICQSQYSLQGLQKNQCSFTAGATSPCRPLQPGMGIPGLPRRSPTNKFLYGLVTIKRPHALPPNAPMLMGIVRLTQNPGCGPVLDNIQAYSDLGRRPQYC